MLFCFFLTLKLFNHSLNEENTKNKGYNSNSDKISKLTKNSNSDDKCFGVSSTCALVLPICISTPLPLKKL